jgi:ssDNA-binding Zn-finger/Zn-ribbon topoisomerase 1
VAANLTGDLFVTEHRYGSIKASDDNAWFVIRGGCPSCQGTQGAAVAYTNDGSDFVMWGRCVNCKNGFVVNRNGMSPSQLPLRPIRGLEPDTEAAWGEIRSCLSVGATTAAVHMCRKVLLHVAVEKGLPAKNDKDRAPTFAACIDHLSDEGYVTPPMKSWVEKIKDVGNDGAHELPQISAEAARMVAEFTLQLLVLTYEMAALMAQAEGGNEEPLRI